ncbi:hypothetical protein [Nitrosomonas sp. Nm166]|uniref:hypothetical protein n=1 Tax=Nitrosomonas sp. Nm166 TaxID=1881054 RepID=UPI000B816FE3|nr:hypothetical protein [Nitrosomonas sp. Nm166]
MGSATLVLVFSLLDSVNIYAQDAQLPGVVITQHRLENQMSQRDSRLIRYCKEIACVGNVKLISPWFTGGDHITRISAFFNMLDFNDDAP